MDSPLTLSSRHVVICTPVKHGVGVNFFPGLLDVIRTNFPGTRIDFVVLGGQAVNFARNEMVHHVRSIGATELVFVDEDMGWSLPHFIRLLSHSDLDVVAGIYCKKIPGPPYWLMNLAPGAETDPATGLCEVEDIAPGFMKIKVSVFDEIARRRPDLEYFLKPEDKGEPQTSFEWFPMGVVGPRMARARLERIKDLIASNADREASPGFLADITAACYDKQPPGNLRGEDYYFCHLVRECGFKIYADFGMPIVPHLGLTTYPITPDMVGLDPAKPISTGK